MIRANCRTKSALFVIYRFFLLATLSVYLPGVLAWLA
jgi:hypothetical protein